MARDWNVKLEYVVDDALPSVESHDHKPILRYVLPLLSVCLKQRRLRVILLILFILAFAQLTLEILLLPRVQAFQIALDLINLLKIVKGWLNASDFERRKFLVEKLLVAIAELIGVDLTHHD